MAGEQGEIDEGEDIVNRVVMLSDAESPAELRAAGTGVCVRYFANDSRRDSGLTLGEGQRVFFNAGAIGVEAAGRLSYELLVGQSRHDDFAAHGVGQGDVRTNVKPHPTVSPPCGSCSTRVDDTEFGAMFDRFQKVVEEDRVRLARIGAPQEDVVCLFHLSVRTCCAACAEDRRQTGDAGGMSSAVATVNVVAPNHRADEFLRDVVQFIRRFGTTEHAERSGASAGNLIANAVNNEGKGFFPGGGPMCTVFPKERSG
jgi:hypothetical protein